ncbi:MAG: class I SAM-dependent methyltransferase [Pseudomonadota bacterium]
MESMRPFLDFYGENRISPVAQNISDLKMHYGRRDALYRHLGIVPSFVRDRTVLEFGPGSGYNSIYTNSLKPARYILVEANPTGLQHTSRLMAEYAGADSNYEIINSQIEDSSIDDVFDIVLCEGVIPGQSDPKGFLRHIAEFVSPGGILVITCMDSVSTLSEILRMLLGSIIVPPETTVEEKLAILRPYFRDHLSTLIGMSRPIDDWILDCVIQFLGGISGELLSIHDAIDSIASEFDVYGSSPRFLTDWRWHKQICLDPNYNRIAIDLYYKNVHNLLDYRYVFETREIEANLELINMCNSVKELHKSYAVERDAEILLEIKKNLIDLSKTIGTYAQETSKSVVDFISAIDDYLGSQTFPVNLGSFAPLFGRGQQYLSFVRRRLP